MRRYLIFPAMASAIALATCFPALGQIAEPGPTRARLAREGAPANAQIAGSVGAPSLASDPDARWDDRFSHPHPGIDGVVFALAVDGGGSLYAGGVFNVAGGGAASNVARWSQGAWSALGAGTDQRVSALVVDGGGHVLAGGSFVTAGGVGAKRVARWDGASWSPLGAGVGVADTENVSALALDAGGNL